jgi:hypothetical protein
MSSYDYESSDGFMVFMRIMVCIALLVISILLEQSCTDDRRKACESRGGQLHCDYVYKSYVCGCYTPDGRRLFDDR